MCFPLKGMEAIYEIAEKVWDGLILPLYFFDDPRKRINWMYLLSSILLAYYVFKKTKSNLPFYKFLFSKKIWLSKSAFIDYKFFFFNGVIKVLLIVPILKFWEYLGVYSGFFFEENLDLFENAITKNQVMIWYPIVFIIFYDFMYYLVHLAMHKIPFLWEFHKIHHSATTLNPITQYRIHPVELLINNANYILVSGITYGLFDYLCVDSVYFVNMLEVNILTLLFLFWGANLRHSHVRLKYFGFLEKFLISPYQHQIHHSKNPKHFDKNMGSKLAIWDWTFGTLVRSGEGKKLHFGLGGKQDEQYTTFLKNLFVPFKNIIEYPIRLFRKKKL